MKEIYSGWAVQFGPVIGGPPGERFAGIFAFDPPAVGRCPIRTALFDTREEAREALRQARARGGRWSMVNYWKGARPVRVALKLEVINAAAD